MLPAAGAARTIRVIRAFAWYRRRLDISLTPGANTTYALLVPLVDDAYEVYWNGKLIGGYGKVPPHPRWYYASQSHALDVPSPESGTIAIRVWKSPLLFVDPASLGGMNGTPVLGMQRASPPSWPYRTQNRRSSICMTSA
jgi:hypothetical protein